MAARLFIMAALLGTCILSSSPAADQWTLTDAQFKSRPVVIDSIDAAGIHATTQGSANPATIKWSDVLEFSRPATPVPATGTYEVYLSTGDRLLGDPVEIAGEKLQWKSPVVGEIGLPLSLVSAISRAGKTPAGLDDPRKDDVLLLANKDTTHGIVSQITGTSVTIQADGANPTLGFDAVTAILFATPPGNIAARTSYRIRLADGTSVTAQSVTFDGSKFTIALDAKNSRQLDLAMVTGVEQLNGPISWLTSHRPIENIYRPFFAENFPTRFEKTVDDLKPIPVKFPGFRHGIGCHSYSELVYGLDGSFTSFRTQYAVESDSPLADVTVRIKLDDKVVFEQKNVKGGKVYPVQTVALDGAKRLTLEVDYGANYATEGRFAWLDPALVRTP